MNGENYDLDDFFNVLFSETPKDINTVSVLPVTENQEDFSEDINSYNFEFLINIYMKALYKIPQLIYVLENGKLDIELFKEDIEMNIKDLTFDYLKLPQKWFNSFGIFIKVRELDNSENYDQYYCKIINKSNPADKGFFIMKNITKEYFFILNSKTYKQKMATLQDYTAIIIRPKSKDLEEQKYVISFERLV
jgi:hypothetical protein